MKTRVSTEQVLESKAYSYFKYIEPPVEPEYADVSFGSIVRELSAIELGSYRLYKHQYEAYEELMKGRNVVMVAGTGSGKTEAWFLYFSSRIKENKTYTAIAVYPTLALANDQVKRLEKYMSLLGKNIMQIDSIRKEELVKLHGLTWLKTSIANSNLVVTNPAFLLHDMKKYFIKKNSAVLSPIYHRLNMLVIDELDFYSPRSIALLLGMIKLLARITEEKLQVVVLSAGLSNPEDLCEVLAKDAGRECSVIRGKPFRVENHVYVVLGKNLHEVWKSIKNAWPMLKEKHKELEQLTSMVEDFEEFKQKSYYVISVLEGLGYDVPSLSVDPSEIIAEYFNDEYVTIVFTRSISTAEELVRSIKSKYGQSAPIASHHHLISKKLREEVEERARRGEIKVIVSPRTLSQGIDIGLVARIVHLGLPDSVRELYQREGRKGRRRELGFSESVIIPYSKWDRELLSNGLETLKAWLDLGIEKTIINPDNLYTYLFTGVVKLKSPWFKEELDKKELEALVKAGVLDSDGRVNEKALDRVYTNLNFYEYAPPYGIKRYVEKESGELVPLEPIGHCDLVEKFQPGCIDYSEDSIVVSMDTGRSSRHVRAVIEKDIRRLNFHEYDGLSLAVEEYRYIKLKWGEKPQIVRDILAGRITSDVLCVVYAPKNGFGRYIKVPERCIWTLRSEKPKVLWVNSKPIVYYEKRSIYVPMPTGGEYRDFTYGYSYAVNPQEDAELMRLALAYLMVILRRFYGIPFETIMYDVVKIGEYKYFSLYEPEAAGIIDKIDWLSVRKTISSHIPDILDRILVSEIDDLAYSTLITIDFNWNVVREQAIRVVDYVLAREKIRVVVKGKELLIPRPSPALRLLSYAVVSEVLGEDTLSPILLSGHGFYDGESFQGAVEQYPPLPLIKPPRELLEVESSVLNKVYYEEFKLLVENKEAVLQQLKRANLRGLVSLIEARKDLVVDFSELAKSMDMESVSAEEVASIIGVELSVNYARVREALRNIEESKKLSQKHRDIILKYIEEKARALYVAYLLLSELSKTSA